MQNLPIRCLPLPSSPLVHPLLPSHSSSLPFLSHRQRSKPQPPSWSSPPVPSGHLSCQQLVWSPLPGDPTWMWGIPAVLSQTKPKNNDGNERAQHSSTHPSLVFHSLWRDIALLTLLKLSPPCRDRLFLPLSCIRDKRLDCSPTNRERELGLDRRETG